MPATQKYLLVVGGPTASGKTGLAIALARYFSTVILSADSRQFYHELEIGNARPSADELAVARHYFVADRSVEEPLSAGAFAREALTLLEQEFQDKDVVVLVGGSGLFVRALTEGLDEFPSIAAGTRAKVDQLFEERGLEGLQNELAAVDPDYYAEVDQQNPARLRRALEVFHESGQPYSSFRQQHTQARSFQPIYLQPHWPRAALYDRINRRVHAMIAAGLEEEARSLERFRALSALQTVGYQEWWPYFAGEQSMDGTVELIQQNSRNYAKRQLTWNRRDGYWKLVPQADLRAALSYIHLVRQNGLVLKKFPASDQPILHGREERKRLGLIHQTTEEVMAVVDLAHWKKKVVLRFWKNTELGHHEAAVLLHEACYRADTEEVYTITVKGKDEALLQSLGWKPLDELDNPLLMLLDKKESSTQYWIWQRSKQEF
ncbi:MAG: tRNA (adenosine(37)-N6)-dimethylallyltransferase MiaA [Bacteroidota bacterium]